MGTLALTTFARASVCPIGADYERFEFSEIHMGVRVAITLYAESREKAESAARSAFAAFADVDRVCSDYLVDSELNRLCRQAGMGFVFVSDTLFNVLARARQISLWTDGAFDVTTSPLVRLWRTARQSKTLPEAGEIAAARRLVGWWKVSLDPTRRSVALEPGVTIDLGAIAKGYGCDRALEALTNAGIASAMVEAGGDITVSKAPPGTAGWTVAIRGRPGAPLVLSNGALSTSGDTEQFVEIAGVRYSHIVDPFTGYGLTNRIQVSVFAKDGLTSDPLATTICIVGDERGRRLAKRFGVDEIIVLR